MARIKYLPAQEKDQIQDFRNWMESSLETSTRSTPESPIIGLIESSTILYPNMDMLEALKESALEVPAPTPFATTQGASSAAGIGNNKLKGRKIPLFD